MIGTKPYSTLTILVITDYLLICILCWRCPRQHIYTRKVHPSRKWWCFIVFNPFWLTDSSYFLDSSKFNETMRAISKEYSKSKEEFILHFKRTYSEPYPPSWILGELLTIGNVNAIYRNIKQNRIRKRIAKRFGLPINVFESWLTVIAVTRNACGHHSRVWNKQNAIQPAIPNSPAGEWITQPTDSMRAYFDLCIIKYFLNVISPNNDMQSKLTWLFIRFPEIDLKALGFPQGWKTEPLWR